MLRFTKGMKLRRPPLMIETNIGENIMKKWINNRLNERTTLDGAILIAAGVVFLIFEPIASIVAYGAIAYGAWTLWKPE
jgi:hypothetical protein